MSEPKIPKEAAKAAAKAIAFKLGPMLRKREFDANALSNAALAAAYPLLRQQIETEVREQIAQEIEARVVNMRSVTSEVFDGALRGAAALARGAAQPGGKQ